MVNVKTVFGVEHFHPNLLVLLVVAFKRLGLLHQGLGGAINVSGVDVLELLAFGSVFVVFLAKHQAGLGAKVDWNA